MTHYGGKALCRGRLLEFGRDVFFQCAWVSDEYFSSENLVPQGLAGIQQRKQVMLEYGLPPPLAQAGKLKKCRAYKIYTCIYFIKYQVTLMGLTSEHFV